MLRRAVVRVRLGATLAGALALISPLAAFAQTSGVAARVTDRIDNSQLVTLSGNTHALARAQFDQGAAPPGLPMNRIMLVLKRSADQETALQNLLTQQQVNSSPSFHKWLTPDQFGQQFGPADADIQAVTSWLASYGFQSIKVSRGRTVIEFSGTAAQVAAGLHTSIHKYTVNGESHWANASDPQIPAALAPVIAGVASLHNFPKRASSSRSTQMASLTRDSSGKPQITFTDNSHGLAPGDFNKIYNIDANTMTGAGMTIGVVGRSNINVQDVIDFRAQFSLAANPPTIILNGPDPGDAGGGEEAEAVLDATWSGAVAPAATVDLVISETTNAAAGEDLSEFYIIDNNLADVMTESFSVCEAAFLPNSLAGSNGAAAFYSGLAEQAAAQGITYTVASGDSGPDGCADPNLVQASGAGPSVNLLASTPFTVAVGGTQFNDTAVPSNYWNASNTGNFSSAKSYIPENVWNESCTVAQCTASLAGLWSSGGGASIVFTKPSWQAGVVGIPSTPNARFLPDVSMAAAGHDGYVLCLDASCEGSNPGFAILSGTSASAQVFGGVMALVDQKVVGRVGVANFALYKLASPAFETLVNCNASAVLPALPPGNSCIFNDVTFGNTNLTIVGETGFSAAPGPGYDEATGLGSVNVTNLVNNWHSAVSEASTTTLTLNNSTAVSITHGSSVPVSITVAATPPGTGTPTGDVSLIATSNTDQGVDGFTLDSTGKVSSSTTLLPGGTYQVHAHYGGDGTFLGSDSTPAVSVTVNPEPSQVSVGLVIATANSCSTVNSVTYGSPYVLTVTVADQRVVTTPCAPNESGSIPTGTVSLTDTFGGTTNALDGPGLKLNSLGEAEDQAIQLPVGTHTIKASYSGDPSFSSSGPTSIAVTVTKAQTRSSFTTVPTTVAANTAFSMTVLVDTETSLNPSSGSSGATPTGTITFLATTQGAFFVPTNRRQPQTPQFIVTEVLVMLSCMFLLIIASKRRHGLIWIGSAVTIAIAIALGCGSGSGSSTNSTVIGTATLTAAPNGDANGFSASNATLSNIKLSSSATITATYSGDSNYSASASPAATVTVQ